jgi:hypothetical protein
MVDYVKLTATAERLIAANGRTVTFISNSVISTDSAKPWGPKVGTDTTLVTSAVFVPPTSVSQFGLSALGQGTEFKDLIAFSEYIAIFFPGTSDCRQFIKVQDGTETFGIIGLQILKPGNTQLLGFVGIRR